MNRIFEARGYVTVPDGTEVSAFLNATDTTQSDVPWGALGEMSIASGRIRPKVHSWVHVHPAVTQVIYLLAGALTVRMKDAVAAEPYDLHLRAGQAVVSEPGTLCQLRNDGDTTAEVLYIVSPSYVLEVEHQQVKYEDAVLVAEKWEKLDESRYDVPALRATSHEARAKREESMRRLAIRKAGAPSQRDG